MKNFASLVVLALMAGLSMACGSGGDVSGPSGTTPEPTGATVKVLSGASMSAVAGATVTILSGDSMGPVAGATVAASGQSKTTDAGGTVVFDSLAENTRIEISHPGFLLRSLPYKKGEQITLWPVSVDFSPEFTLAIVYYDAAHELFRLSGSEACFVLGADLADSTTRQVHEAAADSMTEAVGGKIRFRVFTEGESNCLGTTIKMSLLQGIPYTSINYTPSGYLITAGTVAYGSMRDAQSRREVLRSMLALFILNNQRIQPGLTNPDTLEYSDLTPQEKLAMRLMLMRTPGNRYPDYTP